MSVDDFYKPGGTCRNCGSASWGCRCKSFNIEPQLGAGQDIQNQQQLEGFVYNGSLQGFDFAEVTRLANRAHFVEAICKCVANEQIKNQIIGSYDKHYPEPEVMRSYGCAGCGFSFDAKRKPKMCPDCGQQGTLAKDPK